MGSQVKIKTVLDAGEAPEPVHKRKEYYSELEGLLVFPVDTVVPFTHNGVITNFARIERYIKYDDGHTTVFYTHASEPSKPLDFRLEFNWILKLSGKNSANLCLEKGKIFAYVKPNEPWYRDYPVGIPIELWRNPKYDELWRAVALGKVHVKRLEVGRGQTKIEYEILHMFDKSEREAISRQFI